MSLARRRNAAERVEQFWVEVAPLVRPIQIADMPAVASVGLVRE
jgi:hypothetical protein